MNDKHNFDMLPLNNTTNYTNLDCPVYGDTSEEWIDFYNFWPVDYGIVYVEKRYIVMRKY